MKLITWNVNSVRLRCERLLGVLARHQPDLVCLQELKCSDDAFPHQALAVSGYQATVYGQKGYNGVALLSRQPLGEVQRGFAGDPLPGEARVLSATIEGVRVIGLYVVNGQSLVSPKYQLKLEWLDALGRWLAAEHRPEQPLVLLGDFNIAPEDRDVHAPELWRGRVLCSDPERWRLGALLRWGLRDLLRLHTEEGGVFTWWDYGPRAFARNEGLRLDLVLGTEPVAARCRAVTVDREERRELRQSHPGAAGGREDPQFALHGGASAGGEQGEFPAASKPSDHAPVIVVLE